MHSGCTRDLDHGSGGAASQHQPDRRRGCGWPVRGAAGRCGDCRWPDRGGAGTGVSVLQVAFSQAPGALLRFGFGHPLSPDVLEVACPRLAGAPAPESWFGDTSHLRVCTVEVEERDGDVQAAAEYAYRQLMQQVRGSTHPYLIRIWNYLDAINEG